MLRLLFGAGVSCLLLACSNPIPETAQPLDAIEAPQAPHPVDRMRAELASEFATGDDFTIVSAVRGWAYANIDRAGNGLVLDHFDGLQQSGYVRHVFELLDADVGGFHCGGTATVLAELYKRIGYEAEVYNFGDAESGVSHVVTLVKIEVGGEPVWSIQDAYFGFTVMHDEEPADFHTMLEDLRARNDDGYEVVDGSFGCKPYVTSNPNDRGYHAQFYPIASLQSHSENTTYCQGFRLGRYTTRNPEGARYLDLAETLGYPRNFLYLFLRPI